MSRSMIAQSLHFPWLVEILAHQKVTIRPKSGHIRPNCFRWQVSPYSARQDLSRELLHEKQLPSDELSTLLDELLEKVRLT